ncbi:aminotransferase class IV [Serpentinicella alkaliphila]|uniref:Branched-chain amino acid aminotransferase n=1 Tax=Serpentinicella alkaliphila TaxID=1734049 RepID=A0A4R2TFE7_9FIRM|nr:aminotransferase class IV [Serpentinicella alkaliphila]QUH24912.1 aminotransferase class IV [Serpentinicella alkaliphila]TCQ01811.1 branched-chain amino acid aminotransferase [Serpentinicella alkaliphila]
MNEIQEKYYILNGTKNETKKFNHEINLQNSVYEVIRVLNGVPLFVEEHLDRLNESFKLIGSDYSLEKKQLISYIDNLIKLNDCYNKNIKIVVTDINEEPNSLIYFIVSNYPTKEEYSNGVNAVLFKAVRDNPNAKVIHTSFRESIKEKLDKHQAYEAILVNHSNEITEGSRSNIFLVKDNTVFTPPADDVLKGITRKRIIELCNSLNICVIEKTIAVDFLKESEGLFMTGTSPKVLPIASVDDLLFNSNVHPLILKIIDEYNFLISNYIKDYV